jgi:hypothetical protein
MVYVSEWYFLHFGLEALLNVSSARTLAVHDSRQKHKHKYIRVGDAHVTRQNILGGGIPAV